jgi:hypothetical protein
MISVLGAEKLSLVEIEAFLAASDSVRFVGSSRLELYKWVERLLCHHEYPLQGRRSKGLLRAYIERMTGLRPSPRYGPVSSAITLRPTWSCWPRSTRRTSGSAGRPRGTSSSASFVDPRSDSLSRAYTIVMRGQMPTIRSRRASL